MRTPYLKNSTGSALVSASLFAGVLAILSAGMLKYMSNEYLLNQQGHVWNQALHLSEAGVEIGYSELHYHLFQGNSGFASSRGWTNLGGNAYSKTVSTFTNANGQVIGSMSILVSNASSSTFNAFITAVGNATNTSGKVSTVSRAVLATIYKSSHFPVALMSKDKIDMNGNNVYVDSYDSSDASKSTSGAYDAAKRQANGNVASNGTFTNTVNIGNADVYGVAYTGPGGSVSIGSSGSIGPTFVSSDRAITENGGKANGWIQSDFNVDVPSVILPTGAASWTIPAGAVGSGDKQINKSTTLNSGDYRIGTVTLNSSSQGDTMTIAGNVRLYVVGAFDISGLGSLVINPGASLTVYIGGDVKVTGNGFVNNAVTPDKNVWFALDTSTTWTIAGNGSFSGGIYAPNATVSFKGGGSSGDASGAIVAKKVILTGNAKFHYDENFKNANTGAGYSVVAWQELRKSGSSWIR